MQFEVYKDKENKLYIDYYVAVAFSVGDLTRTITIGDRSFIEVDELEIDTIEEISNNTETPYTPVYFYLNEMPKKKQNVVQFEVYNDDGTYYIDYYVAVSFAIKISEDTKTIGNRQFVRVEEKDIKQLIDVSKFTETVYSPVEFKLYNHPTRRDSIEVVDFEVYVKDDKYLVDYIVAVSFGVGSPHNLQKIGNRTFVEINKEELDTIIDRSNETEIPYIPHMFNAVNTKHIAKLLVYCDENDEYYIDSNAADVLGIKLLCLDNIKPYSLHSHITKEELNKIIEDGKDNGIEIEPEFIKLRNNNKKEISNDKNINIIKTSNRLFLPEDLCEEYALGNKDVSIKIDNKLYYETNDNELNELKNNNYKIDINEYKDLYLDVKPKKEELVILEAFKDIENSELYLEDGVCAFCNIGRRTNAVFINGRRCYQVEDDDIRLAAKLLNAVAVTKYFSTEKTEVKKEKETLTIISTASGLYLDEATCIKLSIPSNKGKTINNKMYYRINEEAINRLSHEYELEYKEMPQKVAKFIVCTLEENVYVEEYLAKLFKFNSLGQKVRIEGKIYYQVTPEQIQMIIDITSKLDTKLEPEYREIKIRENKPQGMKNPKFNEDDYKDEFIPGTDIFKPRDRRYDESTEDYEYFLTRYYLTFFPDLRLPNKYRLKKEEINQDTNNVVRK